MADHSPSELLADVLVHLREVEFVLEELLGELRPKSWLAGTDSLADVSPILSIIADQIGV